MNGKPFIMYKFRTMVTNAEQLKQELAALERNVGAGFQGDQRSAGHPVGRLLRKTSMDEFPQLFNVLRFEMSLVGPRPLPVDEVQAVRRCGASPPLERQAGVDLPVAGVGAQ